MNFKTTIISSLQFIYIPMNLEYSYYFHQLTIFYYKVIVLMVLISFINNIIMKLMIYFNISLSLHS